MKIREGYHMKLVRPKMGKDKNSEYRLAEYHFDVTDSKQCALKLAQTNNSKN